MKRGDWIRTLIFAGSLAGAPVWGQNYPPPENQYPQQAPYPQPYPQQAPYPQQPAYGQDPYYGNQPGYAQQPPSYAPEQLDAMVGRVALYPDGLLAQVLTAATFPDQIPDADGWARAHAYMSPDEIARAIQSDQLPWDPSVVALLPFPSVLDTLAGNMAWTQDLGNAVLANRSAVMDAVQRQRELAWNYGYLRSNSQIQVVQAGPGDIEILPAQAGYMYVPSYNPYVVYARPRPGFYVGSAISFGPGITIGAFAPWGWSGSRLGWREHRIIVNNRPWERTWVNRQAYVHPYSAPRPRWTDRRVERHELRENRRHGEADRYDRRGRH